MRNHSMDPWLDDETLTKARPFAVGFKKKSGEPLVYGSFLLAACMLAVFLITGSPEWGLIAIPMLGLAYWYYPMIAGWPQLGANDDGLFVERIGFIHWACVEKVSLYETSVRTLVLHRAQIILNRNLEEAIAKREAVAWWRYPMMRNWSLKKLENQRVMIDVQLHTLSGDPHEICRALNAFLRR
ncbi:hypothetical protein E1162_15895 [Rhodobacteraceae bacterium RKSG542]|uniref:hypothetical protein n=1 Tax=Pseudovibrio flavus TaxID=2529854 RepID=UPI0012BBE10A|nr:hypothetical protein [Pseudovibrio flavus]MTI18728.1 hypothetical protein [Pseudovibrio flavus]